MLMILIMMKMKMQRDYINRKEIKSKILKSNINNNNNKYFNNISSQITKKVRNLIFLKANMNWIKIKTLFLQHIMNNNKAKKLK